MEELAERLSSWIREQAIMANRRGLVFGLSGGLDSSVVAALCKMAFPQNTLGVLMPCHSSQTDLDHAQKIARKFDLPTELLVLDEVFDTLLKALPDKWLKPETRRLAEANLKSRLRMLTLYYLANRLNYLVVGTGNKSELAVGYFTKHGDSGVDIMPLGNLVKGQVRNIAHHLGVLEEIIEKTPSGGLWDGQTDEQELGVTYEEIDRYLTTRKASGKTLQRIRTLGRASAHKRRLPPIPPK